MSPCDRIKVEVIQTVYKLQSTVLSAILNEYIT